MKFKNFYGRIKCFARQNPKEYIQEDSFIKGCNHTCRSTGAHGVGYKKDCVRKDVPVWFGDINNPPKLRILVVGKEPRATDDAFDVEQVENVVYAAAFGADRWTDTSKIKRKPQLKYFKIFADLLGKAKDNQVLVVFTDCVKEYKVFLKKNGEVDKKKSDEKARRSFVDHVKPDSKSAGMLEAEIDIINPTHVIALGKDVCCALRSWNIANIIRAPHPADRRQTKNRAIWKEVVNKILNSKEAK